MLSTEPGDRSAAEDAVALMYREGGLAEPAEFVWCDSPRAGAERYEAEKRTRGQGLEHGSHTYNRLWIDRWHENLRIVRRARPAVDESVVATELKLRRGTTWASQYVQFIPAPSWTESTWENVFGPMLNDRILTPGPVSPGHRANTIRLGSVVGGDGVSHRRGSRDQRLCSGGGELGLVVAVADGRHHGRTTGSDSARRSGSTSGRRPAGDRLPRRVGCDGKRSNIYCSGPTEAVAGPQEATPRGTAFMTKAGAARLER